jgi:hypothetical protein
MVLKIIFAENLVVRDFPGGFLCHAASVRRKFVSVNLRSPQAGCPCYLSRLICA